MNIRLNVAAVIVRDGKILLVEFDDESGLHYNLPGGGVEVGEGLHEALRREVREETSAELADIGEILMVWEYVPQKQNDFYGTQPKVALLFRCDLAPDSEPLLPVNPDPHQTGVRWIALEDLQSVTLYPQLTNEIIAILQADQPKVTVYPA